MMRSFLPNRALRYSWATTTTTRTTEKMTRRRTAPHDSLLFAQTNDDDEYEYDKEANIVNPLLGMVMNRAMTTLAYSQNAGGGNTNSKNYDSYAGRNMDNANNPALSVFTYNTEKQQEEVKAPNPPKQKKVSYLGNPNVTPTALAHSLWENVILPHQDTVIDATCGNGKDALALAKMLFPTSTSTSSQAELLCIDIQKRACQNTQQSLSQEFEQYIPNIRVLQTSHSPLPMPRSKDSVGLACYNLGWLPSTGEDKLVTTQTQSTLESISDAALLLRVGGLLSVMTYPGTNMEEANAVHHFCTGLAMFTSQQEGGWEKYLQDNLMDLDDDNHNDDEHDKSNTYNIVHEALTKVRQNGPTQQTWRVMDHRPLGRPLSPILITAMRIK